MDFNGKSILDFGSGTGVLSILAHKMKANSVIAIDIDEWAFENIKENIRINHTENWQLADAIRGYGFPHLGNTISTLRVRGSTMATSSSTTT